MADTNTTATPRGTVDRSGIRKKEAYERLATVAEQLGDGYMEILALVLNGFIRVDDDVRDGAIKFMRDSGWYRP